MRISDWSSDVCSSDLREKLPQRGRQAYYSFENGTLLNRLNRQQSGSMKREGGKPGGEPVFKIREGGGQALVLNGDVWLDLNPTGIFRKADPFSIGLWVYVPAGLNEGVIFHKGIAERLYNFRGYHLYLRDGQLELSLAHTAPANAITRVSRDTVRSEERRVGQECGSPCRTRGSTEH